MLIIFWAAVFLAMALLNVAAITYPGPGKLSYLVAQLGLLLAALAPHTRCSEAKKVDEGVRERRDLRAVIMRCSRQARILMSAVSYPATATTGVLASSLAVLARVAVVPSVSISAAYPAGWALTPELSTSAVGTG